MVDGVGAGACDAVHASVDSCAVTDELPDVTALLAYRAPGNSTVQDIGHLPLIFR